MANQLLPGKIALITGAATGIGRVCASLFAEQGAKLVLVDVNVEEGERTTQMVRSAGGEAIFVRADVANASQVEAAVSKAVEQWGRLDCALNNAGIDGMIGPTADCTEANFDQVIAVNLKGVFLCMKYELQQMLKQGRGSIVNMSSVAGLGGYPGLPAYVAAKHGVVGLTRALALELARKNVTVNAVCPGYTETDILRESIANVVAKTGIRVNALCPGAIRTPMLADAIANGLVSEEQMVAIEPIGRLGEPIEVAEAAAWLCSDKSSFMLGHALAVDGGILAG